MRKNRHRPKYTLWVVEGFAYGRVDAFPDVRAFLEARYNYGTNRGDNWDDGNILSSEWKQDHPLKEYVASESPKVTRGWYRYTFEEDGDLYLREVNAGGKGAFELWHMREW